MREGHRGERGRCARTGSSARPRSRRRSLPQIGYAKAAEISKQSVKEGVLIRDLVKRDKLLPDERDRRRARPAEDDRDRRAGRQARRSPAADRASGRASRLTRPCHPSFSICRRAHHHAGPNTDSSARCTSRVAADEGPVTGREIAAREQLPGRLRRADPAPAAPRRHRAQHARRARRLRARAPPDEISVREVIAGVRARRRSICTASRTRSSEERCSSSHNCSIRPVWMLLQRKIDDVLDERAPLRPAARGERRARARRADAHARRAAPSEPCRAVSRPAVLTAGAVRLFGAGVPNAIGSAARAALRRGAVRRAG